MKKLRAHIRFITKLVGLVALAVTGSLFIVVHNPRFKESLQIALIRVAEKNMQAQCSFTITNISSFPLSVTLADVVLQPFDKAEGWQCMCKKIEVGVSFFTSLAHCKVATDVVVSNASVFSSLQGRQIALLSHLEKVFALPAQLPCFLHTLESDSLTCAVADSVEKKSGTITCSVAFQSNNQGHKIECELLEGAVIYHDHVIFSDVRGIVNIQRTKEGAWLCAPDCLCVLPALPSNENIWALSGTWTGSRGTFFVHNQEKSLMISPCAITLKKEGIEVSVGAVVPLSYGAYFLPIPYPDKAKGTCSVQVMGTLGKKVEGVVTLANVGMGSHTLESVKTSFSVDGSSARGVCTYQEKKQTIALDWLWDADKNQVRFVGGNTTPITLFGSLWQIPIGKLYVKGALSSTLEGSWSYTFFTEQEKTEHCFAAEGTVFCKGFDFMHTGTVFTNDQEYFLDIRNAPFALSLFEKDQKEQEPLLALCVNQNAQLEGSFDAALIQSIGKQYMDIDLFAQGRCVVQGHTKGMGIEGRVLFDDGMIRKSPLYNFIQSVSADFAIDFLKRTGSLTNIFIGLQKGCLQSSCIRGGYDTQHQQWWYHAPLTFANCFINWKKDLYVLASGAFIAQKKYATTPLLEGFLLFDTAHLKENIFSQEVQQQLLSSSAGAQVAGCDLRFSVVTRAPLIVKTPQLETKVYVDVMCTGATTKPEVSGTLALEGGMLHFSAYSLPIVKGVVLCGGATLDPRIELVAQGRIKKYRVTLSVTGTAQDPHITFDAYPWLSQEQIMMLLIAGNEEESLNILAPALVMRTIENSIFGSSYRTPTDSWLAPLRRIKFVPRFMDQTGRGGFKGAIEIEVNKRLRASIEKNFSLTEDVAFEVQYAISDDVSIRGGVDERGDLGAELEMRCKF